MPVRSLMPLLRALRRLPKISHRQKMRPRANGGELSLITLLNNPLKFAICLDIIQLYIRNGQLVGLKRKGGNCGSGGEDHPEQWQRFMSIKERDRSRSSWHWQAMALPTTGIWS